MSNKFSSLILSAFLLCFVTDVANGCTCFPSPSPCYQFQQSQAVFVGLVTSVTRDDIVQMLGEKKLSYRQSVFQFTVEEPLKGVETKTVEVVVAGNSCGYAFEIGERYLVYAYKKEAPTHIQGIPLVLIAGGSSLTVPLSTMMCTRTQPVKQAVDDLELIRALNAGKPETRIFGRVYDYTRRPEDSSHYSSRPMADVTVKADNETDHYEVKSDSDGRYQFRNIKPGKYKVTVVLPEGYKLAGGYNRGPANADISRTCAADISFHVHKGELRF